VVARALCRCLYIDSLLIYRESLPLARETVANVFGFSVPVTLAPLCHARGTLQTHLSVPVYPPDISSREGSISIEHHYPSPDTCPYLSTLQITAVAERALLEREEW
jgi:hypothetical protein